MKPLYLRESKEKIKNKGIVPFKEAYIYDIIALSKISTLKTRTSSHRHLGIIVNRHWQLMWVFYM